MAMRDPYQVLGLTREATAAEIKRIYHTLAKRLHPDLNPDDDALQSQFAEVTAAYHFLSDPDRRALYDRGDIDASGLKIVKKTETTAAPSPAAEAKASRWSSPGSAYARGGAAADPTRPQSSAEAKKGNETTGKHEQFTEKAEADIRKKNQSETFAELLKKKKALNPKPRKEGIAADPRDLEDGPRGRDTFHKVTVSFAEAASGVKRRITLLNGKTIDVSIPAGVDDRQKLVLKRQGEPMAGGQPGNAIVDVTVEPHGFFERKGNDVYLEFPIALHEAVLGGTIRVPTLSGMVNVKVPPGANTDTTLRLKGRGMLDQKTQLPGDQYVKLKLYLPEHQDSELLLFLQTWIKTHSYNPREKVEFFKG